MENLELYDKLKSVPDSALKTIGAGRLKGKSDINPQWRYNKLTEVFGPCGFGWKFTIDKQWTEKYDNGEIACFVNVSLFVKHQGEWSDAIPGNGGSMFVANESKGPYVSDECFKMATTDAIGTAAKMIGLASDVYMGLKNTPSPIPSQSKYDNSIKNFEQSNLPWLNEGTENYAKVVAAMKTGYTIDQVKKKYKLSKAIETKLIEESK